MKKFFEFIREIAWLGFVALVFYQIASYLIDRKMDSYQPEQECLMDQWSRKGKLTYVSHAAALGVSSDCALVCKDTDWTDQFHVIMLDREGGSLAVCNGETENYCILNVHDEQADQQGNRYQELVVSDEDNRVCIFRFIIDKKNQFLIYREQEEEKIWYLVDAPEERDTTDL